MGCDVDLECTRGVYGGRRLAACGFFRAWRAHGRSGASWVSAISLWVCGAAVGLRRELWGFGCAGRGEFGFPACNVFVVRVVVGFEANSYGRCAGLVDPGLLGGVCFAGGFAVFGLAPGTRVFGSACFVGSGGGFGRLDACDLRGGAGDRVGGLGEERRASLCARGFGGCGLEISWESCLGSTRLSAGPISGCRAE